MKPLLRVGVPLWSLLISSALLKICQTSDNNEDYSNQTEALTTAATNVTAVTSGLTYSHSTVPGTVYPPTTHTTPAAVTSLQVTDLTTSSVSLSWTKPTGQEYSFKVQWTNGTNTWSNMTTGTSYTISELTSGVRYNVTVSAVAADGHAEGKGQTVSLHTRPGKVVLHSVDTNTSSISLSWASPPGLELEHRVEWNSGNNPMSTQTVNTSAVLFGLVPGTNYTIMITVVVGDNVTGESYTLSAVTKPAMVGNLIVTNVTTSSVSLSWAPPEGNVTWYIIRWAGEENNNTTTTETSFVIENLTPGSQYSISVAAVAVAVVASNEGGRASTTTFTRPEKPENITLTSRGTDNLSIRWSLPKGKFQYFRVNVTEADSRSVCYNGTKANTADITGLGPGRIFAITVSTVAGNFAEASEEYRFATVPTPPGSITSWNTNSSLTLEWETPALMDGTPDVSYSVAYQSSGKEMQNITTSVNHTELSNLSSGTFYNITLKTIGVQYLESTAVNYSTCTRPNPVLNLVASPKSTSSLEVQWSYPQGAQSDYTYLVLGPTFNTTVRNNSTEIANLKPGTKHRITVKTIVAAECESTEEETHAYTMPQAVTNLTVADVKTMAVGLEWLRQTDYKPSYSYLVAARQDGAVVQSHTTANETYTIINLTPGQSYQFDVFTVVEVVKSEVKSISSDTRPAPATNVTVTESTTNLFVSWSAAAGQVLSYTVLLYRDNLLEASHQNLDNRTVNAVFTNRTPGVYYCVVVVSKSGSFETNSSEVCRATVPNPPGSIFVESRNIHYINFSWSLPENMDHQQYNFTVSSFNGSVITKNNWFLLDSLQSGSLYNISVATLGVSNYESVAVVAESYTRPYPVHSLTEDQATTNAVTLSWEQLERKTHYSYVVQASNESIFWSETVNITRVNVTGLIPGGRYSFTVISQTADGTQGTPVKLSSYTQPDTVEPSVSSQGSNSSLLVSWSPPLGRLERYCIRLNSSFPQDVQEQTLANSSNHHMFGNLSAGRLYSVQIAVHSGPKEALSGFVSNATFPNPPGPIDILAKTNSSIDIKWSEAPLMTVGSFSYQVSITSPGGGVNVSNTTSHSFASLLSGTPHNISVLTVGALGFLSEEVQIYMVNTKPFNVKNLRVSSVGENQTTVVWDHPDEYKESYRYNVTWKSSENVESIQSPNNTYSIPNLVPGSLYHFFVTTETSDGTQADSQSISSCTDASPVSELHCQSPNTEDATLQISWVCPSGQYSAFQVILNDSEHISFTNTCCALNVSSLRHHTSYKLTVKTQSCGQPSTAVSQKCWTGITNPPIVQDHQPLVNVAEKTHNRFSIRVDHRLLNDTNGPVTHVGVLVANQSPGNASNWRLYLGRTYDEWKESQASVYLAAVKSISSSRRAEIHHTLQVGDGSKWEGYSNGALIPGQKYHYAVVLFTDLSLENNLVNGEKSLVSSTSFSLFVVLNGDPVIGIAVGATLGIFFILFIIILGFIIYWRRLSRKEETDIQIHSMRPKVSVAVRMEDYEVYYRKQKADSNCGFAEEFEDLKPVGTDQPKNVASFLENKPKNRYNNVLPYDSSRVKLSIIHGNPYDDYINANYMPGYNSRKEFIAAQGPLPATVKDFWRMIWEKNVQTLVMLTRCNEQGRVKCEQYWDYGTTRFENINVTSVSDIPLEDWTIRDFDIKNVKTAETRSVRQFHFTAWPDHGVPETTELLISFRHLVREHMDQYSRHSPTVVHCSAGVGRTGTFIAIDRLIFQIERENIVDVYGIVHDLRMHRPLMVQTEDQYVFLNQCAMDIIRSRTGTNVDLIYQNTAALSIYENVEPHKGYYRYPDA